MAIYKRGKVYWYEFVHSGRRIRESTKQANANVARTMEGAARVSLSKAEHGIGTGPRETLERFAPRFQELIETRCADKPATVEFYSKKLKNLLQFRPLATSYLDQIDERLIESYTRERARTRSRYGRFMAPASINRELATLRRLLRVAHEWRMIQRVPRIRLLRGERSREYTVSPKHEELYFGAVGRPLGDVARLLLDAGVRVGEALSLEWRDVHLKPASGAKFGYLTVRAAKSKNSRARNVPLTKRVSAMLQELKPARTGYVFKREDGRPLAPTLLNQQHARLRKLLKLPDDFVLHSFRHTFGTRLGESGADAFTIMKLMGHSTVTVSQRYVHPTPETLENAVERMEALTAQAEPKSTTDKRVTHKSHHIPKLKTSKSRRN